MKSVDSRVWVWQPSVLLSLWLSRGLRVCKSLSAAHLCLHHGVQSKTGVTKILGLGMPAQWATFAWELLIAGQDLLPSEAVVSSVPPSRCASPC